MRELKKLEDQLNQAMHDNIYSSTNSKLNTKNHRILNAKQSMNGGPTLNGTTSHTTTTTTTNTTKPRTMSTNGATSPRNLNGTSTTTPSSSNKDNNNYPQQPGTDRPGNAAAPDQEQLTWIHELFQGILVNETKCLNCETVIIQKKTKIFFCCCSGLIILL
jgi:hypothetical protein